MIYITVFILRWVYEIMLVAEYGWGLRPTSGRDVVVVDILVDGAEEE